MKAKYLFFAVLLAAIALAADPVSLDRKAKAGDKGVYDLALDFKYPEGSGTFKASVSEETKTVSETGFDVERTYKDATVVIGDQQFPQNMPPYSESLDKTGKVVQARGDEVSADTTRFLRLWSFVTPGKPVDTGDTWTATEPEDKDADKPAFEATYKMEGKDTIAGFDCAKVSYTAKESGPEGKATATGTYWVRLTDGRTVKVDTELRNAPNAEQLIDGHLVFSLKP